jgi:hypothetical protein
MTQVLRSARVRAVSVPAQSTVTRGDPRRTAFASAALETICAGALLIAVHRLEDDALTGAVAATSAVLVLGRMVIGFTRARTAGAVSLALLTTLQLLVLAPTLDDRGSLPLAATLVALGVLPAVLATAPAVLWTGVGQGQRENLIPSLVASALGGGVGALIAISLSSTVEIGDARLSRLMPYFAMAMILVGMSEVLGHHRIGSGFPATFAAITAVAVAVGALLLVDQPVAAIDAAVTATAVATSVAALGLLVSTAFATPRTFVVPVERDADGPRLVVWTLAGLVAIGALGRLAAMRPLWLDEAEVGRLTDGSLRTTLDAAKGAHAHPPLFDVLVWGSRQIFGSDDIALRLPSLLAGILLVPAVYVTAVKMYDRRVGVLAAVVAAIGPGFLWISGSAEPAALAALLATLCLLGHAGANENGRVADWLLFGVAGIGLLWTHQLGIVHLIVLHVAAATSLIERRRRDRPDTQFVAGWGLSLAAHAAALIAVVRYRGGMGRPDVLPPFEYATRGAPGAGRSVFGLVGTGLNGLFGFHPSDVTSRMLALWPMCILAAFIFFCRSWSRRGALLVALAIAPFVALLALQVAGAARNPPFALSWVATALPMIAIGAGRTMSLCRRWSACRTLGIIAAVVLLIAATDQIARGGAIDRFDVDPAIDQLSAAAEGDVIVYAPDELGDLVRREAPNATIVDTDEAANVDLASARRVFVFGAFGFTEDQSLDDALSVVHELSAVRPLASESQHHEAKVWIFE